MFVSNPIISPSRLFLLCITRKQTVFTIVIHSNYLHLTADSNSFTFLFKNTPNKNKNQPTKNPNALTSMLYNYSRQPKPFYSLLHSHGACTADCLLSHSPTTNMPCRSLSHLKRGSSQ